jgi:tight adherence protein C
LLDSVALASAAMVGVAIALPAVQKKAPKIDREEVLCRTGLRVLSEEEKSLTALKLTRAGINKPPEYFHGLKVILAGGYLIGLSVFSLLLSLPIALIFLLLPGAIIMWLYPGMKINSKIASRQAEIRKRLDDFATYLSTALTSVPDVLTALQEAGNATGGVYKDEIERVLKENASGKNLPDALFDWASRMDVNEINTLVSTLNQIYIQGAPASEKMKEYASQVRIVKQYQTMELAQKLSIKLILVVTFFMLIPLFMAIGFPAIKALLEAF